ncbi:heparan-alpha-glucosaminide N-acetyltransferase domain-containing protein [Melissospora conviva]|uniref:heparan-alpha-glucosaminide N-acetyltransferase domain-containing protein n=1 Tax=Melissospora conviva TaxID=3388432 RepID=UPI003B7F6DC5
MTETTLRSAGPANGPVTRRPATPGRRRRLVGIDAARGISLLGMIMLHALYEADAAGQPTWSHTAFSGRAAAAFAVLIGVGMTFATGRRQVAPRAGRPPATALCVRALCIGAIGLVLGEIDVMLDSVVLPYIGMMILLAIPLTFLPTWAIAGIGVVMATAMPAAVQLWQPHLPEPSLGNITFGYLAESPMAVLSELTLVGFYPALPWLAFLCAGLVIGRLDLNRRRTALLLIAVGSALAVAAATASSLLLQRFGGLAQIWAARERSGLSEAETTELLTFGGNGTTPTSTWWWLAVDGRHTGTPVDIVGNAGIAIALLGVMLLAGSLTHPGVRRLVGAVQYPLAAVGSLTLTFYAAHIVFINSDFDNYDATTGCLVQVIAVLVIGLAWKATVGRGPLEGIVVVLTDYARQQAVAAANRNRAAPLPPATDVATVAALAMRGADVPEPAVGAPDGPELRSRPSTAIGTARPPNAAQYAAPPERTGTVYHAHSSRSPRRRTKRRW